MNRPEFVRTGDYYPPPYHNIPRGQLRRHMQLQQTPWNRLPQAARSLAEQALKGHIPNSIGNASEFANTSVYFKDRNGRLPSSHDEWREFTENHARRKGWMWIGPAAGLNQMGTNAFFVDLRVAQLPTNIVRVIPPGAGAP